MRSSHNLTPLTIRESVLAGSLMAVAAQLAYVYKPTQRLADLKPKIELAAQIPKAFGNWQEDLTLVPIMPNPQLQSTLDALYSATLARTYRNNVGQRVMVSIAYGSDQSSEATAVHRPEFCYSAQGFRVSNLGEANVNLGTRKITVQRLNAEMGQRHETITYWITMDETTTLPGFRRKYEQIRYGLNGQIPDGMLFRVSSIGADDTENFKLQGQFLNDLVSHVNASTRDRYFGHS